MSWQEPWRTQILDAVAATLPVLRLDEECQCHCFLGHPGVQEVLKKPCGRGSCPNQSGLSRAIVGLVRAYARGKIDKQALEDWKDGKFTYTRVSCYIKSLQGLAEMAEYGVPSDHFYNDLRADRARFWTQLRNEAQGQRWYYGMECRDPTWWVCGSCTVGSLRVFHPPDVDRAHGTK